MKNVNQEGSLCLEKKYGEIKENKQKKRAESDFLMNTTFPLQKFTKTASFFDEIWFFDNFFDETWFF